MHPSIIWLRESKISVCSFKVTGMLSLLAVAQRAFIIGTKEIKKCCRTFKKINLITRPPFLHPISLFHQPSTFSLHHSPYHPIPLPLKQPSFKTALHETTNPTGNHRNVFVFSECPN
jgi:hypothetical protein